MMRRETKKYEEEIEEVFRLGHYVEGEAHPLKIRQNADCGRRDNSENMNANKVG